MTRQPPSSPHFSNSLRPALRFRRGSYGVGRRKRIGAYGCAARRRRCPPKGNPKDRLKKPTGCVAALVPRTRSSHNVAASLLRTSGSEGALELSILLVSLWFRSSHQSLPQCCANFGTGTLARCSTSRGAPLLLCRLLDSARAASSVRNAG